MISGFGRRVLRRRLWASDVLLFLGGGEEEEEEENGLRLEEDFEDEDEKSFFFRLRTCINVSPFRLRFGPKLCLILFVVVKGIEDVEKMNPIVEVVL